MNVEYIVLHCSASPNGLPLTCDVIRQWHLARGFRGIGYHYVITIDGVVHATRGEQNIGAHAKGYNAKSLGICMVGGTGGVDKYNPGRYNLKQWHALAVLITDLETRYPNAKVVGHRDLSPDLNANGIIEPNEFIKLCPSFSVADWLANQKVPLPQHVL
jgi:N-acetyl-anhydromuramyl-L-alanine amidase AmpD